MEAVQSAFPLGLSFFQGESGEAAWELAGCWEVGLCPEVAKSQALGSITSKNQTKAISSFLVVSIKSAVHFHFDQNTGVQIQNAEVHRFPLFEKIACDKVMAA